MERLYYNIGQKLKKIAIISAVILAVACVIGGIVLLSNDYFKYHTTRNMLLVFAGPFVSWFISLPLYALGEIVDRLVQIEENTRYSKVNNAESSSKPAAGPEVSPRYIDTASPAVPSSQSKARFGATLGQSPDGVFIRRIDSGSTADIAGMRINDKLLEINGTEITNIDIARYTIIHSTKPGQTVPFVIERDGVKMTLNVTF